MTAGPSFILGALSLTATEKSSGYTGNATQGGPDVNALLQDAVLDLQAAALKLHIINGVIPTGSNATAIAAQYALLTATS